MTLVSSKYFCDSVGDLRLATSLAADMDRKGRFDLVTTAFNFTGVFSLVPVSLLVDFTARPGGFSQILC